MKIVLGTFALILMVSCIMTQDLESLKIVHRNQSISVADVRCQDGSSCADQQTCCRVQSGGYGCCPTPNADCCPDLGKYFASF